LSKKILGGQIDRSHPVLVDVFDGLVVFRNESAEQAESTESAKKGKKATS